MIDELLRRAGFTTRAAELEAELEAVREEKSSLEERLEAEERRRSEAARERQAAEEEVNRLEDRIAQLEGTVERLRSGDATADDRGASEGDRGERAERGFRGRETLRRGGAERVLERLQSVDAPPEGACTAVVEDRLPGAARDAFGPSAPLVDRAAPCVALTDDDGLVSAALRPPVLPEEAGVTWDGAFRIEREHLLPAGEFALALVRSDVFALGEYRGEERVAFRGFESDVKDDHSKGGFSQGRFERRRDAQIEEHLEDCEAALAERDAERLYLVGHREAIDALDVAARATAAVDATGDPEAALDRAFDAFWTTRLFLL